MILPKEIEKLSTLSCYDLTRILAQSGYSMCSFESVEFLGITNGGNFCYSVTYFDDGGTDEIETDKVFISKNATGDIVAEF